MKTIASTLVYGPSTLKAKSGQWSPSSQYRSYHFHPKTKEAAFLREAHFGAFIQMINREEQEEEELRTSQNIQVTEMSPVLL